MGNLLKPELEGESVLEEAVGRGWVCIYIYMYYIYVLYIYICIIYIMYAIPSDIY